jgi:hypothetical protein
LRSQAQGLGRANNPYLHPSLGFLVLHKHGVFFSDAAAGVQPVIGTPLFFEVIDDILVP